MLNKVLNELNESLSEMKFELLKKELDQYFSQELFWATKDYFCLQFTWECLGNLLIVKVGNGYKVKGYKDLIEVPLLYSEVVSEFFVDSAFSIPFQRKGCEPNLIGIAEFILSTIEYIKDRRIDLIDREESELEKSPLGLAGFTPLFPH